MPTIFQWEKTARGGRISPFGNYMPSRWLYPWRYPRSPRQLRERRNHAGDERRVRNEPLRRLQHGRECIGMDPERHLEIPRGEWRRVGPAFVHVCAVQGYFRGSMVLERVGFRSARRLDSSAADVSAMRIEVDDAIPTYAPPLKRASFDEWLTYYRYAKTPLDAKITDTTETADWRRETITFSGAKSIRANAYLYLPKNFARPLQVIHFLPPSDVENGFRPISATIEGLLGPCIKAGRSVFGVVLQN